MSANISRPYDRSQQAFLHRTSGRGPPLRKLAFVRTTPAGKIFCGLPFGQFERNLQSVREVLFDNFCLDTLAQKIGPEKFAVGRGVLGKTT